MTPEVLAPDGAWSARQAANGGWHVLVVPAWRLIGTLEDDRLPCEIRAALSGVSKALMTDRLLVNAAALVTVPPQGPAYVVPVPLAEH